MPKVHTPCAETGGGEMTTLETLTKYRAGLIANTSHHEYITAALTHAIALCEVEEWLNKHPFSSLKFREHDEQVTWRVTLPGLVIVAEAPSIEALAEKLRSVK